MLSRAPLLRLARIAFWSACVFAFISAVLPAHEAPHLFPWDKAAHFTAFYVLGVLGAAAYPRSRLLYIGAALSALGAAIEVVQGLSFIHRDRDVWDWVADTVALGCALGPLALVRWRAWAGAAADAAHRREGAG